MADDGYVLEFRNSDSGKDMFASNADAKTRAPKLMWDEKRWVTSQQTWRVRAET
jgi:hypothetical protein